MKKTLLILFFLLPIPYYLLPVLGQDSVAVDVAPVKKHHNIFKSVVKGVGALFQPDTNYIEPQHYKLQAMVQSKLYYHSYGIKDDDGNTIRFSQSPSLTIGPYAGWSLLFFGLSLDVLHLKRGNNSEEYNLNIYSLPFGIDFFWQKSGDSYNISKVKLESGANTSAMSGIPFSGFESTIFGLNIYYIFNHKKFSYPAAFNQSTIQKRSRGSFLIGMGYTRHSLDIDWDKLKTLATEKIGEDAADELAGDKTYQKINYTDLSISGGYAYNWVFAKNWLVGISASAALSYKHSIAESDHWFKAIGQSFNFQDFSFSNLTVDGTGRLGIVWNNMKWFAGLYGIVNTFNYTNKKQFSSNNTFGYVNLYVGFNFWAKKKYRRLHPASP